MLLPPELQVGLLLPLEVMSSTARRGTGLEPVSSTETLATSEYQLSCCIPRTASPSTASRRRATDQRATDRSLPSATATTAQAGTASEPPRPLPSRLPPRSGSWLLPKLGTGLSSMFRLLLFRPQLPRLRAALVSVMFVPRSQLSLPLEPWLWQLGHHLLSV